MKKSLSLTFGHVALTFSKIFVLSTCRVCVRAVSCARGGRKAEKRLLPLRIHCVDDITILRAEQRHEDCLNTGNKSVQFKRALIQAVMLNGERTQ